MSARAGGRVAGDDSLDVPPTLRTRADEVIE
jgi:hypothetical protein